MKYFFQLTILTSILIQANQIEISPSINGLQSFIISSQHERCKVTYYIKNIKLKTTSCKKIINSKKKNIFCTPSKKVCKLDTELTSLIGQKKGIVFSKSNKQTLLDTFNNLTYSFDNKAIKLVNGKFSNVIHAKDGFDDGIIYKFLEISASGYLTKSKEKSYVLSFSIQQLPDQLSDQPSYAYAIVSKVNGKFQNIASSKIYWKDCRQGTISTSISNKKMIEKYYDYKASDPMCCPSIINTRIWEIKNNNFVSKDI